jgi:hypothetical protein
MSSKTPILKMLYYDDSMTVNYPPGNAQDLGRWQHEINNFDAISLNHQDCKFKGDALCAQLARLQTQLNPHNRFGQQPEWTKLSVRKFVSTFINVVFGMLIKIFGDYLSFWGVTRRIFWSGF